MFQSAKAIVKKGFTQANFRLLCVLSIVDLQFVSRNS